MERYESLFAQLKERKEGAFVPFVTLGDPGIEQSLKIIDTLIEAGADALELGIPFSDPLADGPTIQNATLRAFAAGVTPAQCFEMLALIRQKHPTPTIRLSKAVEAAGADALSVITPYFLKPTNENLYAHYKAVAESVNIPIVLYNIPKATGCPLDPELVDRLADFENIQGIKDSSGEPERLQAYAEISKRKDLQLLVGSDSKISYAYGLGATGAVAGTSNVIVDTLVGLDKALRAGETEKAEKLQKDIDVLRGVLKLGTVPSVMKRATELAGIAEIGPARLPVQELTAEDDEKIKEMLKYYGLN